MLKSGRVNQDSPDSEQKHQEFDKDSDNSIRDPDFIPEHSAEEDSKLKLDDMRCEAAETECVDDATTRPVKRARKEHEKHARNIEKYKLLPPCCCPKKCIEKVTNERRVEIHRQFWNMTYDERRCYIHSKIHLLKKKRPRKETKQVYERTCTRSYSLPDATGDDVSVCKQFFLRTLGYTSDKVITATMGAASADMLVPPPDKRGRQSPHNKMSEDVRQLIESHIRSYNPAISHYRREHAPHRLYLPTELSITSMHADFKEKHSVVPVSYETYRKAVTSMNISFAKTR